MPTKTQRRRANLGRDGFGLSPFSRPIRRERAFSRPQWERRRRKAKAQRASRKRNRR